MGRDTTGVKGMTVKGDARVLGLEIAPKDSYLMVITEKGYGKRTAISEYPEQHRGGQGVNTINITPKKGNLAGMKVVQEDEEILISTEEGVLIRTKAKGISKLGRATQGVKIMDVGDNDKVIAIARYSEDDVKDESNKKTTPDQGSLFEDEDANGEENTPEDADGANGDNGDEDI